MTQFLFIYILLIHFLGDFALQTHEQATLKSTNNKYLFYHVGVYSLIWLIACIALGNMLHPLFFGALLFAEITFVSHYTTDYITSRISKPFFAKGDYHNGFVVIGFDQVLHYLQLYFTFKLFLG